MAQLQKERIRDLQVETALLFRSQQASSAVTQLCDANTWPAHDSEFADDSDSMLIRDGNLDVHKPERAERADELFHVLPKKRFLIVGGWAYVPVRAKAMLYQLIPVFGLYEPGAIRTGIPVNAAMIGRVLLECLGISAEIAARRLMLHQHTPCF